jgi:hypothetical protein
VASISPDVLKPGQSSTVAVEGHPPLFGERSVEIRIPTNNKDVPQITMKLVMEGAAIPPYVLGHTGPLNLGTIRQVPPTTVLEIETIEVGSSPPWIREVISSIPQVVVEGTLQQELTRPGNLVQRKYAYSLQFTKLPPIGTFTGHLVFFPQSRDFSNAPILNVPILGNVRGPVSATPSHLYGTTDLGGRLSAVELTFVADMASDTLQIEAKQQNPKALIIKRKPSSKNIVFEITSEQRFSKSEYHVLRFTTNLQQQQEIEVPIYIKHGDR